MEWPRPRFTLQLLMVAVALMAICTAFVEYELRRRRAVRLLLIERNARIDARLLALDRQNALVRSRIAASRRGQVIYAEEWSGNPRRPNRHGLSSTSLESIRRSMEDFTKRQDELNTAVKELEQYLERITQSPPSKP
jgi:hypothetical protein